MVLRRAIDLAHRGCGNPRSNRCARDAMVWRLYAEGPVDAHFVHRWLWSGICLERAGTCDSSAANDDESSPALREGDYSIRARGAREEDALGEALLEVNALGETLRLQRLGAFEATALLRTVMTEIDVAVFTSIPNVVCGWSIAREKICLVVRWTSCLGAAPLN